MPLRLFKRRKTTFWDPGASPVAPGRRDKPDLAGRRAFMASHILLHTHLPKTGGSTLSHGLAGIVGAVHTMDLRLRRRLPLDEMTDADLEGLSLLSGHFPYGVHDRFDRRPLYIAAVREPIGRAISNYRFLQTHPDHPDHKIVVDKDFETAWQAMRDVKGQAADNMQARQLTATPPKASVNEDDLWDQIEKAYFLVIPQPELTRALQRLRAAFGAPWTRMLPHNVSKGHEVEPSTELRARILDANRADMELYARVSEDFDRHLERACDYIASHCLLPLEDGET